MNMYQLYFFTQEGHKWSFCYESHEFSPQDYSYWNQKYFAKSASSQQFEDGTQIIFYSEIKFVSNYEQLRIFAQNDYPQHFEKYQLSLSRPQFPRQVFMERYLEQLVHAFYTSPFRGHRDQFAMTHLENQNHIWDMKNSWFPRTTQKLPVKTYWNRNAWSLIAHLSEEKTPREIEQWLMENFVPSHIEKKLFKNGQFPEKVLFPLIPHVCYETFAKYTYERNLVRPGYYPSLWHFLYSLKESPKKIEYNDLIVALELHLPQSPAESLKLNFIPVSKLFCGLDQGVYTLFTENCAL